MALRDELLSDTFAQHLDNARSSFFASDLLLTTPLDAFLPLDFLEVFGCDIYGPGVRLKWNNTKQR